jgi:hypothetical protein
MYRAGFIPSLDKEGWREAPGWFEAAIPQLRSDSYSGEPRSRRHGAPQTSAAGRIDVIEEHYPGVDDWRPWCVQPAVAQCLDLPLPYPV